MTDNEYDYIEPLQSHNWEPPAFERHPVGSRVAVVYAGKVSLIVATGDGKKLYLVELPDGSTFCVNPENVRGN